VNDQGLLDDRPLHDNLDLRLCNLDLLDDGDRLLNDDLLDDRRLSHDNLLDDRRLGYDDLLDHCGLRDYDLLRDDGLLDLDGFVGLASASGSNRYETKGNEQLFNHESSPFVGNSIDKLKQAVTL
jgi:hypothetical protein